MKDDRPTCKPNIQFKSSVTDISKFAVATSFDCARSGHQVCIPKAIGKIAGKAVIKVASDPCVAKHTAYSSTGDPYFKNMPTHSVASATEYAHNLGGEHHDLTCELM